MTKGIFITGTGTDIGKTYISALIVKKLRQYDLNVGYYKGVASGGEYKKGVLVAGDAEYVKEISEISDNSCMVSYVYEAEASPHLAAQHQKGPYVEPEKLINDFNHMKEHVDYITIEGSGGIVCPLRINEKIIMQTDLIKLLKLDIVIVTGSDLGTINSTVLTVQYAKSHNININGIIMNTYNDNNYIHIDNKKQIENLTGIPVIACIKCNDYNIDISEQKLLNIYKELT